jgi:hypothetical protein
MNYPNLPDSLRSSYEQQHQYEEDYRLQKNRREGFLQWWAACTDIGDVDPQIWGMQYLNTRYEHNLEEKYWFAWLYHTYQLPLSWVFKSEFPDEELASVERFQQWTNDNYSKLTYQTDTRYSKGHLAAMYSCYHDWVGYSSQHAKFSELCSGEPAENFDRLWDLCTGSFLRFGRYTTWFYLQVLKHTCSLPLEPRSLYLRNFSGSKSHRNGLCFAAGKDEWVGQRLTEAEYGWLEGFASGLVREAHDRWPRFKEQMDLFALETALCAYKKLWRTRDGRYAGYYLDRQSEDIVKTSSKEWPGIQWDVLWQMREENVPLEFVPRNTPVDKSKMALFLETGTFHHYAPEG